jgi:ferredoxin
MPDVEEAPGGLQVVVFPERCVGAGNCVDVAPSYFDQSEEDGTVVLLRDAIAGDDAATVSQAVAICPVSALALRSIRRPRQVCRDRD